MNVGTDKIGIRRQDRPTGSAPVRPAESQASRLQSWRNALRNPARRRLSLTIASGTLIGTALALRFLVGWGGAWAPLMVAATLLAGSDIAVRAWHALRVRHLSIELLVTIAATGALVIGEFWEAAAVTFLFMIGAWIEARTMRHTRGALEELIDAAPARATVIRDGEQVEIAASQVRPGEVVVVRPGEKIPVDGEIIAGAAAIDESAITGEPIPAEKTAGAPVFAGTIAHNGLLRIEAVGVGADTTLARIVRRVEEAQDEKAPTQRMIERFAAWYTPSIIALAVLAFIFTRDIRIALTLLVVGCPGALVISTPVSIVAGIGRAARAGILIKGGQHLEGAGRITALALDKTGTLTEGRPELVETIAFGPVPAPSGLEFGMDDDGRASRTAEHPAAVGQAGSDRSEENLVLWAAIAEVASGHPLGRPIIQAALDDLGRRDPDIRIPAPDTLEEEAGLGLRASYRGSEIVVGSPRLLEKDGIEIDEFASAALAGLRSRGATPVLVALNSRPIGILGLADTPRPSAANLVAQLRGLGVRDLMILTGDESAAAREIARQVGIDQVHAGLLPDEKLALIREQQAAGHHIAMIGDGINDAPALAAANSSIAMGAAGSDLAIETADIALMTDDLGKVAEAIEISRRTLANMRQNLVIALITVAALLIGVILDRIHMASGMLVHQLSVLAVIFNGMRLGWRRRGERARPAGA